MTIRTYSELAQLATFEERFQYLRLDALVGKDTFGFDRYLNQLFYKTPEWKSIRDFVIIRDCGCDLGVEGYEIHRSIPIYIHHMNPITKKDVLDRSDILLNPDYLVTTVFQTHNAIHYGNERFLQSKQPLLRTRNDTCPWKSTNL